MEIEKKAFSSEMCYSRDWLGVGGKCKLNFKKEEYQKGKYLINLLNMPFFIPFFFSLYNDDNLFVQII